MQTQNESSTNVQPLAFSLKMENNFWGLNDRMERISSIKQVVEIDKLTNIIEHFSHSTGLGVAFFDEDFELLASAGWQKICTHFHQKHPDAHRSCIESQNYFRKNFEPDEMLSYKCKNGLWDIAFPIFQQDIFLGYVGFGQFFLNNEEIEKEFFVRQARKYNFDTDAYISHLRTVPIFPREKLESHVLLFLTILLMMVTAKV
jgi:ligand-binding sensor protein